MDEVHEQFIGVVASERGISRDSLRPMADGRVMTGETALHSGLIDTIGTYQDAILIAAELADIEGEPSLVKGTGSPQHLGWYLWRNRRAVVQAARDILDRPVLSYRYIGP